ncbi:MAG: DeoR/GlpR transcriptional regulator [Selenomonadaceae bacterium]|nr:DeoR/GlpR transcriptional regulator [Selenomonadaceae bacterium]
MLTEERYSAIMQTLSEKKAATVSQLAEKLGVSESTIRRDLIALDNAGRLCKVHGGATLNGNLYLTQEDDVSTKQDQHSSEKDMIARYAAGLIEPEDFVFLDAGTTTFRLIDYLPVQQVADVAFVTNGIQHAAKLAAMGLKVYLPGGRLKPVTQALVGTEAVQNLSCYNFTKGFFGANGISSTAGFSTPDFSESKVKTEAMQHCRKCFVLADSSKFKRIFPVTFARLPEADIITDVLPDSKYKKLTNIIEVGEEK